MATYAIIGALDYPLENGDAVFYESPADSSHTVIINNSDQNIVIERIIYVMKNVQHIDFSQLLNDSADFPQKQFKEDSDYYLLRPYSGRKVYLGKRDIHYFFDDKPPQNIKEHGASRTKKFWLHIY